MGRWVEQAQRAAMHESPSPGQGADASEPQEASAPNAPKGMPFPQAPFPENGHEGVYASPWIGFLNDIFLYRRQSCPFLFYCLSTEFLFLFRVFLGLSLSSASLGSRSWNWAIILRSGHELSRTRRESPLGFSAAPFRKPGS